MIASEVPVFFEKIQLIMKNFTSKAVLQVLGSCLTNKYSEGLPGERLFLIIVKERDIMVETRLSTKWRTYVLRELFNALN